jgi:hypothetical protein
MSSHTITPAADLQAAIKKTLHSAAFVKFMGQAVQAALAEAQAQPHDIVLPVRARTSIVRFSDSGIARSYTAHNPAYTHAIRMQCEYLPERPEMRGVWYGIEDRTDEQGDTWSRSLGHHVQDDFGNLVAVPE